MYEQALECYEGSLEITLPALGEDHPEVAALYVGLAGVCNKIGMYEESVGIYDKALAIYFPQSGPTTLRWLSRTIVSACRMDLQWH